MTYHHRTLTRCDTCDECSSHATITAALAAIDDHILHTGHQTHYYRTPDGWLLFGGI